jgi:hypothetical protein
MQILHIICNVLAFSSCDCKLITLAGVAGKIWFAEGIEHFVTGLYLS